MVKQLIAAAGILAALGLSDSTKWRVGDAFCGGGGTSTGIVEVPGCEVVWAINHDETAIASHKVNHPTTKHYIEDILEIDLGVLSPIDILWASLECTHFSNAKGGQSRDADSRMLAWGLLRYVKHFRPKYLFIENVREFMSWGPLVERGGRMVPDTDKNKLGSEYKRWVKALKALGYNYRHKLLNSADFGAHTSRLRYFGVFALEGYPIRFPAATHHKTGAAGLPKWKAVREVLDFEDRGESVFTRKKALADNTLRRTLAGTRKHVLAGRAGAFVTKYLGNNAATGINTGCSVNDPAITVTTQNRLGLVQAEFLSKAFGGNPKDKNISVDGPAGTVTTVDHHQLVQAEFMQGEYGKAHHTSMSSPCPSLLTNPKQALVQAEFLFNPAWGGHSSSVDNPAPTVVARQDKAPVALVQAEMLFQNNFNNLPASVDAPARTLTTNGGNQFLMTYYGQGGITGVDQACPTLTTKDRVAKVEAETGFLFSHQFSNEPTSLADPARTLVASRRHQYLALLEPGACPAHLLPAPGDSLTMRLLKYVCRKYGIADIRMRMLKVQELLQIQGFPADYVLLGTQTQQKKFIGNAVVPHVARALVGANVEANTERLLAAA